MKTVLIIGLVFPEPNSSAAGTRMLQLVNLFQEQNYRVIFASSAQETEFSFDLNSIGVEKKNIKLNHSSFDLYVKELNPAIVLFDRFISEEQFGWRVIENCPDAIRILDSEDLHCLRYARQKAVKKGIDFDPKDILKEPEAFREIASIYRCDLTLMISEYEIELLQNVFKIDQTFLFYLPLFYEVKSYLKPFELRKDFVFIGNFLHDPNYDAVLQLKTFWHELKKNLPETVINIYGAYTSKKVEQLHNEKEGFMIRGRAENALDAIENARVLLAPLRFGAGIKGKLLESMVVGTPSITTSIGGEGISTKESWNGFICEHREDFISRCVSLYSDKLLWQQKQNIGETILKDRFSKEKYTLTFTYKILQVTNEIESHRTKNFVGNLLSQNQYSTTKFMSKWIEEKNKN